MVKYFPITLLLSLTLFAADIAPTTENIRSYPLVEGNVNIKANLGIINSDIDLFGIRSDTTGRASNHGSIGDYQSLDFGLGYGAYEYLSLFYDFSSYEADYAGESLQNTHHELFAKLNIYNNPTAWIETFSVDVGLKHNSADDLKITGSNLGISQMDDMQDSSFYVQGISGTRILSSILDLYLGLSYVDIKTKLDNVSYDRDEIALNLGFQYTLELGSYLVETGYEYVRMFKREIDGGENSNHLLNLTLSKVLNRDLLLFIGTHYYTNQLGGVVPYLYHEKTKDAFDQRFGYMSFGFVYNFNMMSLSRSR